jgi:hypothetical protein
MGRITDGLIKFLEEDDWNFNKDEKEDHNAVYFSYTGKQGKLNTTIIVREQMEVICVYSKLELTVTEDKLAAAAEFVCRANYGLLIGNFELDFRDGEVRYKSSADLEGAVASNTVFRNLLHANLSTSDRYHKALKRLLVLDDLSPEQAIEEAEGGGGASGGGSRDDE